MPAVPLRGRRWEWPPTSRQANERGQRRCAILHIAAEGAQALRRVPLLLVEDVHVLDLGAKPIRSPGPTW